MKKPQHNGVSLLGAGGHAKVILDILESCDLPVNGLYDDRLVGERFGYPIKGRLLETNGRTGYFLIALGDNAIRKKVAIKLELQFISLSDRSAIVSPTVRLGKGTVIMPGTVVNAGTVIGEHAIINTSASVDHDCVIEDFVHIAPNSTLCGNVQVGEGTLFGAGAVAIPGVKIGKNCTVGAGAVVVNDVPAGATVVGNPAKIIKSL